MHITLLLAEHCSAASATLALEMLSAANLFADSPPFEVVVASLDGQAVNAWAGSVCKWTVRPRRSGRPTWC